MVGAYSGMIIGNSRHQTFATEKLLNVEKDQAVRGRSQLSTFMKAYTAYAF